MVQSLVLSISNVGYVCGRLRRALPLADAIDADLSRAHRMRRDSNHFPRDLTTIYRQKSRRESDNATVPRNRSLAITSSHL
jgi:hypothetical protein